MKRQWVLRLILLAGVIFLASCQPAAPSEPETVVQTVVMTQEVEGETVVQVVTATPAPIATAVPTIGPSPTPVYVEIYATPAAYFLEDRQVEFEWPNHIPLEKADVVRLSFNPTDGGFEATLEAPGNQVTTTDVQVKQFPGYQLHAGAVLNGAAFDITPAGEQAYIVTTGEPLSWRWFITPQKAGTQKLSVTLRLFWTLTGEPDAVMRESVMYSRSLDVDVTAPAAFEGVSGGQVMAGMLVLGGLIALGIAVFMRRPQRRIAAPRKAKENPDLQLEPQAGIRFTPGQEKLLRSLFARYDRLAVNREFLSGYSGARALLVQPIKRDGRKDAHAIVKISEREAILREYENYEKRVKATLPPMTARIQQPPVVGNGEAALQYTFVGTPGSLPGSLRQQLLERADPALLWRLFETFGPNWWTQRRAYTFRAAREYDRKLPVHYYLEPAKGVRAPHVLDGSRAAEESAFKAGDLVTLANFPSRERRADGKSWTLTGEPAPGFVPVRVRWEGTVPAVGRPVGRVKATRQSFLEETVRGFDLLGLADPLPKLAGWLDETVQGTQAVIHGDLNLENVLVSAGGTVWLIDFAETREGHPMFDFAHLHAEIIAHVLAPQINSPAAYLEVLRDGVDPLLNAMEGIAGRCLFDPADRREYAVALALTCLGALKYANLDAHAKHLLYLTAAGVGREE